MKIFLQKYQGALRPVDEMGEELLHKFADRTLVSCEIRQPRNLQHHRKFFALLNLVYENQERYPSVEQLLSAMKVALGHCDMLTLKDGKQVYIPKSIAFHKMDQLEFDKFWDRVVKLVCEKILPGMQREDLEREILELVS